MVCFLVASSPPDCLLCMCRKFIQHLMSGALRSANTVPVNWWLGGFGCQQCESTPCWNGFGCLCVDDQQNLNQQNRQTTLPALWCGWLAGVYLCRTGCVQQNQTKRLPACLVRLAHWRTPYDRERSRSPKWQRICCFHNRTPPDCNLIPIAGQINGDDLAPCGYLCGELAVHRAAIAVDAVISHAVRPTSGHRGRVRRRNLQQVRASLSC
jgi:hypothetical protein